jgi:deoxyribodipyrimidine photolyase-related protein
MRPKNYRGSTFVDSLEASLGIEVEVRDNNQFMCLQAEFDRWLEAHRSPSIDTFYRMMRKTREVLVESGKPAGGRWNFDRENYMPPAITIPPPAPETKDDRLTRGVIEEVNLRFPENFGELEHLSLPVDRESALVWERDFIGHRLESYGLYENLMLSDHPVLFRSRTSALLNAGLLSPGECIAMAEEAYDDGKVSLPSAEGYIRRIMGWREYIAGLYTAMAPEVTGYNYLNARRNLPPFFRDERLTRMNCVQHIIRAVREQGYASHVARLMVLGNFALLAGIEPRQFYRWSMEAFEDSCEWACAPNAICLALYADGGVIGRKPYAASAAFINARSDYCRGCHYSPYERTTEDACPYNFLYWSFIDEEERLLKRSCQMTVPHRALERMSLREREICTRKARSFLDEIEKGGREPERLKH